MLPVNRTVLHEFYPNAETPPGDICLEMAGKIAGQIRKATVSEGVIPETLMDLLSTMAQWACLSGPSR